MYLVVEILQISSFPEVVCRRGDLNNFSHFTGKYKTQSSGGALSKDNQKIFAKFTEKHLCQSLFFNNVASWKTKNVRNSHQRYSVKKVFLKRRLVFQNQPFIFLLQIRGFSIIRKIHRRIPVLESLFNKIAVLRTCNLIKEDSDTGFFL